MEPVGLNNVLLGFLVYSAYAYPSRLRLGRGDSLSLDSGSRLLRGKAIDGLIVSRVIS